MITPTKLDRNARITVTNHGEVAMKPLPWLTPVTSWKVPYNQLVKVGKPELGFWMTRPDILVKVKMY